MERFVIVMPVDTSAYLLPCDDGDTCKLETLQKLPYNEHATDLYAFNYMSSIVGPAVLMAARGDELIGFAKSVAESICTEWKIPLEALGEGERFQTFNPD